MHLAYKRISCRSSVFTGCHHPCPLNTAFNADNEWVSAVRQDLSAVKMLAGFTELPILD